MYAVELINRKRDITTNVINITYFIDIIDYWQILDL